MTGRLLLIVLSMAAQYALVVINMRAITRFSYSVTIGTDALIAANALFLTRRAVSANTVAEKVAYVFGGCCGSVAALWLSRWLGL